MGIITDSVLIDLAILIVIAFFCAYALHWRFERRGAPVAVMLDAPTVELPRVRDGADEAYAEELQAMRQPDPDPLTAPIFEPDAAAVPLAIFESVERSAEPFHYDLEWRPEWLDFDAVWSAAGASGEPTHELVAA